MSETPAIKRAPRLRKKRKALHGEVKVIRPQQTSAVEPAAAIEPATVLSTVPLAAPADETTTPTRTRAKHAAARPARAAQPAVAPKPLRQVSEYDWPKYPHMLAALRALEMEAEQARQREAAAALVWIKQAITTYALSARDLGLR